MGKQYVIKLSPITVTRKIVTQQCGVCGQVMKESVEPIRVLELEILTMLFELGSTAKKDLKSQRLCWDCISQIENLTDAEDSFKFTEEDLKFLTEGFELTAGVNHQGMVKRPFSWVKNCAGLFAQIEKPKTQEELDAENKAPEDVIPPLEDNKTIPDSE